MHAHVCTRACELRGGGGVWVCGGMRVPSARRRGGMCGVRNLDDGGHKRDVGAAPFELGIAGAAEVVRQEPDLEIEEYSTVSGVGASVVRRVCVYVCVVVLGICASVAYLARVGQQLVHRHLHGTDLILLLLILVRVCAVSVHAQLVR